MLMIDCGPAQVHSRDFDGEAMERIWLATLKLSDGSITAFENAVLLAQIDCAMSSWAPGSGTI